MMNKKVDYMGRIAKEIKRKYKETSKTSLAVYLTLRGFVILSMIMQILRAEWENAFLCLFTLMLFTLPTIFTDKFKIKLPTVLESIIYVFIFLAEILGEINNFYFIIPYWDTILHTLNGFLAAGVGFSLVDLLNENVKSVNLSPVFVSVVAFCFSMTIGVLWEFFEYSMDVSLKFDMQKDSIVSSISSVKINPSNANKSVVVENIERTVIYSDDDVITVEGGVLDIGLKDTMEDLKVNFLGAVAFSLIGYLYIHNRDKYKFAKNFIVTKNKE